jgi:uncharacterized protein (DUF2384 family)
VKYEKDGVVREIKLAEDGTIIERETKIDVSALPAAVAEQVKRTHPKAKVLKAELVEQRVYEVEIEEGGKKRTLKVLPCGKQLKSD